MNDTLASQLEESRCIHRPMREDPREGAYARWLKKEPERSRPVPLAAGLDALRLNGAGTFSPAGSESHRGEDGIALTVPLSPPAEHSRYGTVSTLMIPLPGEDLRGFNRLSCMLYTDAPGINHIYVRFTLHNGGERPMPAPERREGIHHFSIVPGGWRKMVWEIPDLYRDRVEGISMGVYVDGVPPEGDRKVRVILDELRIERVGKPEKSRGFALRGGAVAYCHSGYLTHARKQALVQRCPVGRFTVTETDTGAVYTGEARAIGDGFSLLDFTELEMPGSYVLEVGALKTAPFPIGPDAYLSAAWKTLNFFFCERCGFDVPGIHSVCHTDVVCRHFDGRSVPVAGGWHGAGNLAQSVPSTCEMVIAMLQLAGSVRDAQPELCARALEEARWGLDLILRTRFGDGWRYTRCHFSRWTDGISGSEDDLFCESANIPYANLQGASACAQAFPAFREEDRVFANWCLRSAIEDYAAAIERIDQPRENAYPFAFTESELYAQAAISAVMLFHATGKADYIEEGARFARRVRACQQLTPAEGFSLPLRGFFYEDSTRRAPVSYFHRSAEHMLTECFTRLLAAAPEHADAPLWEECVRASADYLLGISHVMEPYGLLPAGIYEYDKPDYAKKFIDWADPGSPPPTREDYNAQVKNGIRLDERRYLRRFPVAGEFRGFYGALMGKAKAAFLAARQLHSRELYDLAVRQMEFVLGFNPFAMSTVYGEGHDYPPLFCRFAPYMVGAVPVGIETFENEDAPYLPMQCDAPYKEVWDHTTCRLMWLIAEAYLGY